MSRIESAKFRCRKCHAEQTTTVYHSITATKDIELKEALLNGKLFKHTCTACGHEAYFDHSFLYHDPANQLAIWYFADGITKENERAMDEFSRIMPDSYRLRLAYHINEAIEKIKIFDACLHDLLVHHIKLGFYKKTNSTIEDIFYSESGYDESGDFYIKFWLKNTNQSFTLFKIDDAALGNIIEKWNKLEEELDWINTSNKNFFPIFEIFMKRFG